MAIRITKIKPKPQPSPNESVLAHLSIERFQWVSEDGQKSGVSPRAVMFDWIVNKQGKAYVIQDDGTPIPVFGANAQGGQYIRSIENGQWTDEILKLSEIQ